MKVLLPSIVALLGACSSTQPADAAPAAEPEAQRAIVMSFLPAAYRTLERAILALGSIGNARMGK